jgi:hypothetical protein
MSAGSRVLDALSEASAWTNSIPIVADFLRRPRSRKGPWFQLVTRPDGLVVMIAISVAL